MALGLTARGTNTHNTGAASFGLSPSGNLAAGSKAVLCVSADNSSSGGATNDFTTVTDTKGNTWTKRRSPIFDNGAASAGVQTAIFETDQNVGALTTGDTITVNFGSSPVAKAWALWEVTHAANAEAVVIGGADQAGATTATPSFASSSIAAGDAVIFMVGMEAGTTQGSTADADTSNGNWSSQQYAEVGSTTSGAAIASQGKVVTGAGAQTYNPTLSLSVDLLVSYVIIHEQHTASVSHTFTGGGVLASTRVKGARSAPVQTGGGIETNAAATNRRASPVETGGGVAAVAAKPGRQASAALTGAGRATIDAVAVFTENHDATVVATGGGVLSAARSSARLTSATAAGGGVVTPSLTSGRSSAPTATGAGAAAAAATSQRSVAQTVTGAGSVNVALESAREAAALLSGGGVLTTAQLTARLVAAATTGGGTASIDGRAVEVHQASVTATGGGAISLVATTGRRRSAVATGAGSGTPSSVTGRASSPTGTAAGRVRISTAGLRRGSTQVLILGPHP